MIRFVALRLLGAVPVLLVVSVMVFSLMQLTPGDAAAVMLGPEAPVEDVEQLRHQLGLDRPVLVQYVSWLAGAVRGDLGDSIFLRMPVAEAVAAQIQPTLYVAVVALLLAVVVALPAGILAARRQGRMVDLGVISVSVLGTSLPSFLLGLLLILVFAVRLELLPSAGYAPPSAGLWPFLERIVLPAAALAAMQAALIARMVRTTMVETLQQNFVTVSRAKGLSAASVTLRHALRNSALPILTVVAQSFGLLISGSIVIETVFNIPGLGQLTINAIGRRDFPVIQGVVLTVACLYVAINLVVDLLYGVLDPRVRDRG